MKVFGELLGDPENRVLVLGVLCTVKLILLWREKRIGALVLYCRFALDQLIFLPLLVLVVPGILICLIVVGVGVVVRHSWSQLLLQLIRTIF